MGYFPHSILVTELSFALKMCKFWFFWNSCEIPEFIVEFEKTDLGYDMGCQFHSISSTKFKSTAKNVIYAQLKKFEINVNSKLTIKVFFFNSFIFVKLSFVTAKLNSVQMLLNILHILLNTPWLRNSSRTSGKIFEILFLFILGLDYKEKTIADQP